MSPASLFLYVGAGLRPALRVAARPPLSSLPLIFISNVVRDLSRSDRATYYRAGIGRIAFNSKFNSSTFTRVSPKKPHCRPNVCRATAARTSPSVIPRSRATRTT